MPSLGKVDIKAFFLEGSLAIFFKIKTKYAFLIILEIYPKTSNIYPKEFVQGIGFSIIYTRGCPIIYIACGSNPASCLVL